ncbi:MAG TPA: hypothetical protein ENI23_16960 [bacterium]|nr:hypothetical protein [bacterium]
MATPTREQQIAGVQEGIAQAQTLAADIQAGITELQAPTPPAIVQPGATPPPVPPISPSPTDTAELQRLVIEAGKFIPGQQTPEQMQRAQEAAGQVPITGAGPGGGPIAPITPTAPAITDIRALLSSTEIQALEEKIELQRAEVKAGIAAGGREAILREEFERAGVGELQTIRQELSRDILQQQEEIRQIPPELADRLDEAGVNAQQLFSLTSQALEKPREILVRHLEQRGLIASEINDATRNALMWAETRWEDKMSLLDAEKFMLEKLEGDYKDLTGQQRTILGFALDLKEKISDRAFTMLKAGATQEEVNSVLASGSDEEAISRSAIITQRIQAQPQPLALTGDVAQFEQAKQQGLISEDLTFGEFLEARAEAKKVPGIVKENKLSISEAKSLGLPVSLVGVSEQEIINQLQSSEPPNWYREILELALPKVGDIIPDTDFQYEAEDIENLKKGNFKELKSKWEEFRNNVLTFEGGGGGRTP